MNPLLSIQHVALHISNVEASKAFFKNILFLEELQRPAFDFPGAWLKIGENQELHLIGGLDNAVFSGGRSNHFALEVRNIKFWEDHFIKEGISFRPPKHRPDGAIQIFLQDPDGYWIELFCYNNEHL